MGLQVSLKLVAGKVVLTCNDSGGRWVSGRAEVVGRGWTGGKMDHGWRWGVYRQEGGRLIIVVGLGRNVVANDISRTHG